MISAGRSFGIASARPMRYAAAVTERDQDDEPLREGPRREALRLRPTRANRDATRRALAALEAGEVAEVEFDVADPEEGEEGPDAFAKWFLSSRGTVDPDVPLGIGDD